ncbi:hypothetical protein [Roseateles sp.]|uniref:hypothetical protein n=1 Tax=Roseateles sp. TaxID=1971397 RepID=UPI0039EA0323
MAGTAFASPGAHGPNGEHLDGPAAAAVGTGLPRIEAHSEAFEIVGRLGASDLVLYVSRYETNEAVLGAKLDVEFGTLKAPAAFQSEGGSYRVADAKFIEALHRAGSHALVFTLTAGADSDLLDGTLAVTAHDDHGHAAGGLNLRTTGAVVGGLALVGLAVAVLRRRRSTTFGGAQ